MSEPPTHYQVSFTTRQALLVFVLIVISLGLAYVFGLMTGLAGRSREEPAVAAVTPAPELTLPAPVLGIRSGAPARAATRGRPAPRAAAATEPTGSTTVHLFEDGGAPEPSPTPAPPREAALVPTTAGRSGFWVQVLSARSEKDAQSRSARLRAHRFHTTIVPGEARGGRVYRVRVGPYSSRAEAAKAALQLEKQEKVKPWIVPEGR